jgi:hypothetical protein
MAKRRFSEVASASKGDGVKDKRPRPLDIWNDENNEDALRPQRRLDDTYHTLRSSDIADYEPPTSNYEYTPATPPPSIEQIAKRLKNETFRESPRFLLPHIGEAKFESTTTERFRLREVLETSPSELHKTGRAKTGVDSHAPMQKHAVPDTTTKSSLMDSAYDSPASLLGASHNASAAEELADEFAKYDAIIYDEAVVDPFPNLAQVRRFLFDGPPFQSFLERVSTPDWNELDGWYGIGQDDPSSSLVGENGWEFYYAIQSKFKHSIGGTGVKIYQVNFIVRWEIEKFVHEELDNESNLSDVFTVTGGAKNAYAGTSLEYMSKTWPRYGGTLLEIVHGLCQSSSPREDTIKIDGHDLEMYFKRLGANPYDVEGFTKNEENDGGFLITISGSQSEIIEVAQQLAWMTASFRATIDQKLQFSRTTLRYIEEINCFRLKPGPLSPIDYGYESSSCWHPLLLGSLVVQGFPIPRETEGVGLEISFDLMVYLAGIRYPIMYKGGIVLKRDAHILVPTTHNPEFTQWHCLSTNSSDKTELGLISKHCPDIVETRDFEAFRQASRIFLGYYKKANVCLGTRDFKGKNMKLSGAGFEKRHLQLSRSVSSQLGFQFFAQFNVGSKVKFSKTLCGTTKAKTIPYSLELERSRKQPLVLCDVATKRDWLVPELSLVLEIARIILSSRKDLDDQVLETLPCAKASPDGGLEALKAITNGESLILRPGQRQCPPEMFMDTIKYVMDALSSRRTKNVESSAEDNITLQKSSTFYGWEVKDVIDLRHIWHRRQICIDEKAAGSWPRDIALCSDILTLFCKDLQDPIKPAADAAVCSKWVHLPEGKHYLGASMRCLSKVELPFNLEEAGRRNLQRLQRLERHKIFDDCDPSTCLGCNRLQDLRAFKLSVDANDESTQDAAVILGNPFLYNPMKPDQRRQYANSRAGEENTNTTWRFSPGNPEDHETRPDREIMSKEPMTKEGNSKLPFLSTNQREPPPSLHCDPKAGPFENSPQGSRSGPDDG